MDRKSACSICGSSSLYSFLRRQKVPVHQNLLIADQKAALEMARGNLEMAVCRDCGFIFNRTFEPGKLSYGELYNNDQTCSPTFQLYLDDLARQLVSAGGVRECQVLEVGCGNGSFLRKLVGIAEARNTGLGFDPSYVGPSIDLNGRVRFERSYYRPESAGIHADVAICRHVIEHVPEPLTLLRSIRTALANSPQGKLFLETPCAEWILRNKVIWDFFYEHCSLFTAESLSNVLAVAGFNVQSITHVFGGQYLFLEATIFNQGRPVTGNYDGILRLAAEFAKAEKGLRRTWSAKLERLAARGKVALWGAGAKGVTFANLVDPDRTLISCIVDINPNKQGKYVPGTGHPVVGYQELAPLGVAFAIMMNPNYREENLTLLRQANINVELIG